MSETIRTVVSPIPATEEKGLIKKSAISAVADVELETLKINLKKLSKNLGELFEIQPNDSGFSLKQIEVGIEITAEGGVNLIGTLTTGASASISLTFERP